MRANWESFSEGGYKPVSSTRSVFHGRSSYRIFNIDVMLFLCQKKLKNTVLMDNNTLYVFAVMSLCEGKWVEGLKTVQTF